MNMRWISWVVIGAAVLIAVTTALGAATRDWQVYCFMWAIVCQEFTIMILRARLKRHPEQSRRVA